MSFDPDPHGRLEGVEAILAKVVRRAAEISRQPFFVVMGLRTPAEQAKLYAQGRTAPGPVVTWVRASTHETGHAVDLAALAPGGAADWVHASAYDEIKRAMFAAASELGVTLRWGADWDQDGVPREHGETDQGHFELHAPPLLAA